MTENDLDALSTEEQTSKFCEVSKRCLQNWRMTGEGPKFIRISSRCVRYRKRDVLDWIEQRVVASTSMKRTID